MTATMQTYRGLIQGKTRIALAWIFAAALVFSARELPTWPGIALCFVGAALRYWASGYLRKDSRPAVGGPYGFVRNPLYLGTYLMALGTAAAAGTYVLFGVLSVVFAAIYHFIILDEETKLERIFGDVYLEYKERVPRFFPHRLPSREALLKINPDPTHHAFSRELAAKNKAYESFLTFLALIGFVAVVAILKKNFS
jgi:protein-S-isoprenylcysteine O-methyltransferase Ste14